MANDPLREARPEVPLAILVRRVEHDVDLAGSWMVGDSLVDIDALYQRVKAQVLDEVRIKALLEQAQPRIELLDEVAVPLISQKVPELMTLLK